MEETEIVGGFNPSMTERSSAAKKSYPRRGLRSLLGAALVLVIAAFDRKVTAPVPLGFLYLLPMSVFGRGYIKRWPVIVWAVICTALAEMYDGFPITIYTGPSRMLLYLAAFLTTGLFMHEVARNRQRTGVYIGKIESQRDALDEAEKQLEALIETSPAAIVTTDSNESIIMANDAAERMLNATKTSLTGRNIGEFFPSLVHLVDGGSSQPRVRAVMQARGVRSTGEDFLAEVCFSTYATKSGPRLTAMVIDTSEELRQASESSLRQLMSGSRLVVGAMSHEIRNVCAAIAVVHHNLNKTEVLADNQDFQALGGLVEALKSIAAMELTPNAIDSQVDVVAALKDLQIVIAPVMQKQQIRCDVEYGESVPMATGDRTQIMQILLNLVNNSVRALATVDAPRLSILASDSGRYIRVEVKDNGAGVQEPQLLFRPFQPSAEEHGLGLYISRAFARSSGGNLIHEASPQGASFVLLLRKADGGKSEPDELEPGELTDG